MRSGRGDQDGHPESETQRQSATVKTGKRSYNMAAHKLPVAPDEERSVSSGLVVAKPLDEMASNGPGATAEPDVIAHASTGLLALGALGVVYGDIGTSPLYTEQTIFLPHSQMAPATVAGVYGIVSLIFWSTFVMVSVKYAGFIMRAHNRGDGGIMALAALCQRKKVAHVVTLVTLGIFGASLFFGDGMITPAISVLSAVSGLEVPAPGLTHLVVPISVVILLGLFVIQRRGTGTVGGLFGPVMLVWFTVLALIGLSQVVQHPGVFQGLSPSWGARFFIDHKIRAFIALGGVVLCVTGAEALYADRGHFGPQPIRFAWFGIVWPAVILNYLGQAAWILEHAHHLGPAASFNPFFSVIPEWGQLPMVLLATVATIIASQAVISGSYSVARQAMQLGYLPRLRVIHTSKLEGQIYVPVINWALATGVIALVLIFQSSSGLAYAYGVAVTGTFILNTILFLVVSKAMWHTPTLKLAALGTLFLTVEVSFFLSNLYKLFHGAWLPLAAGVAVSIVMMTWRRGSDIVTANRVEREGSLVEFLEKLCNGKGAVKRVPGTAVYLNSGRETTPLAMRAEVEHNHTLHEKLIIASIEMASVPHVMRADRFVVDRLGKGLFQVVHLHIRTGYQDDQNVPQALILARKMGLLERNLDLEHASYFLSQITIKPTDAPGMPTWRKKLFLTMARNAASPIEHFGLPVERTVSMGSQISV
ncbi:MAG: potassium transporter Kup [Solirubrobacteraceae bacterium]